VIAPIIETKPPRDVAALTAHLAALAGGTYDWLFVTSAASTAALVDTGTTIPATTAVAAVGVATRRSLESAGYPVAFTPSGASSAYDLVDQWKRIHQDGMRSRVLVMRSDLAAATVSDGLEAGGHSVDVCVAYRTVGLDLEPGVTDDLQGDRCDAVLVTSHSVAIELGRQLSPIHRNTAFVAIGVGTAREAERLGLIPCVIATEQSIDSMLDAVEQYFTTTSGIGSND
jgi:uroporphyrinogen-III synthase